MRGAPVGIVFSFAVSIRAVANKSVDRVLVSIDTLVNNLVSQLVIGLFDLVLTASFLNVSDNNGISSGKLADLKSPRPSRRRTVTHAVAHCCALCDELLAGTCFQTPARLLSPGPSKFSIESLSDYIAPSQACVVALHHKPARSAARAAEHGTVNLTLDADGLGSNIEMAAHQATPTIREPVKVKLADCLACAGCVTSAESVLLERQSVDEFTSVTRDLQSSGKVLVISISSQSLVSLASAHGLDFRETSKALAGFFKTAFSAARVYEASSARDVAHAEMAAEFVERRRNGSEGPMLTSACPGWVCYAEKKHASVVLPLISAVKSPQQIMGTFVKTRVAAELGVQSANVYHVSVMPCYDKKLEASRDDFIALDVKDVDTVLTTGELQTLLDQRSIRNLSDSPREEIDSWFPSTTGRRTAPYKAQFSPSTSGSGGYLEYVFRNAAAELHGVKIQGPLTYKRLRNPDLREVTLEVNGTVVLRFAVAYGFRNIQNVIRACKLHESPYHFVEVMACPSGCLNGGGQLPAPEGTPNRVLLDALDDMYRAVESSRLEADVSMIYSTWIRGEPGSDSAKAALHTQYHERAATLGAQINDW